MIDSSPSLIPVHDTYHAHAYLFGKNAFACNDTFAIYIYIIFIYIHRFSDNIMVISNSHVELPTSTPFANVKTRERPIYIIYDNICIYVCVTTDLLSPVASTKKREMVGWQLKASHPALQTCSPRNIG